MSEGAAGGGEKSDSAVNGSAQPWHTRADFRSAPGVLLVLRLPAPPMPPAQGQPPSVPANAAEGDELLLAVHASGRVTALAGHVDLGTGLRTAYAQIVAEELDWPLERVDVILGDTARAPNQGPTIASTSIQLHAQPLRLAAAQARAWLLGASSGAAIGATPVEAAASLGTRHIELMLELDTPLKAAADYRVVGTSPPRVDIPAKATGGAVFVHDVRLTGMLHGRVIRPPYAGVDAGDFVGRTLLAVHEDSIAHLSGIVKLVVIGDFIGVVAQREDQAEAAMHALAVDWKPWPALPPLDDLAQALRDNPATQRVVAEHGDVDAARTAAAQTLDRDYVWPYQMHASIGPSCGVADWHGAAVGGRDGGAPPSATAADARDSSATPPVQLTVYAGTQSPHVLRADLATLTGLADVQIDVIRMEAAGCYGRNGADDVAADAALLARAVGAPVRVQLTREQEHAWEPKGAAQLMQVRGGLMADGAPAGYDFATSYPSNAAPTLALLLTRAIEPIARAFEMGDRTAVPPYRYADQRITINDMPPILRASWLRGVSALPNSFAHESYIDELASAAGVDPVAYRLRYLNDARAAELVQATAAKAGWIAHTAPLGQGARRDSPAESNTAGGDWLLGQGFAYARYVHSKFPGFGAAWAAWVADVEVHRQTGEVHVKRVVVGHDAGLMINPAGVQHQVHGNVLQTTSRALKERVLTDERSGTVTSREWGAYPILSFREVPVVEVMLMPRPGEPALGVGESASVPGTAAIANAIFDATGVRFRSPPFTPEVVRAAMQAVGPVAPSQMHAAAPLTPSPWQGEGRGGGRVPQQPSVLPVTHITAVNPHPSLPPARGKEQGSRFASDPERPRKRPWAIAAALITSAFSLAAALLGWRPAIAPVAVASAGLYTAETLERGRQLAALGNCAVCHTAPGGAINAGGRAMATPFGTIHTTNLTPDAATGIGSWSFSAFQRAMREGISRDGQHLYPAFPYTAFTRISDDDLMALYAWLQSRPAVRSQVPANTLRWPFNIRPLMAVWNAIYLQTGPVPVADTPPARTAPMQPLDAVPPGSTAALGEGMARASITAPAAPSLQWQRGAYLVNSVGHCGACHTPRDSLGAERTADAYLGGTVQQGWEAPALGSLSRSPVRWTEDALVHYLRQGHSPQHGIAGGPMADVVRGLATVDEAEVRAMAHYLVSLQGIAAPTARSNPTLAAHSNPAPATPMANADTTDASTATAQALLARAQAQSGALHNPAQRLFEGACGACHHDGNGPQVLGLNLPLALNPNLHSERPDNLLRTILDGIQSPAFPAIGHMPAFRHALDDRQLIELAAHLRQRFAPDRPAWADLPNAVARARAAQ